MTINFEFSGIDGSQPSPSAKDKLQAEWQLFRDLPDAATEGFSKRFDEITSNPSAVAKDTMIGLGVGGGLLMAARSPSSGARIIAHFGPRLLSAVGVADFGSRVVPSAMDVWHDPSTVEANKQLMGDQVGAFGADYLVMGAAGVATMSPTAMKSARQFGEYMSSTMRFDVGMKPAFATAADAGVLNVLHTRANAVELPPTMASTAHQPDHVLQGESSAITQPEVQRTANDWPTIGNKVVDFDGTQVHYEGARATVPFREGKLVHDQDGISITFNDGSSVLHQNEKVNIATPGGAHVDLADGGTKVQLADGTTVTFDRKLRFNHAIQLADGTEIQAFNYPPQIKLRKPDGSTETLQYPPAEQSMTVRGRVKVTTGKYTGAKWELPDSSKLDAFEGMQLSDGTRVTSSSVSLPNNTHVAIHNREISRAEKSHPLYENGLLRSETTSLPNGVHVSRLGPTLITSLPNNAQFYIEDGQLVTRAGDTYSWRNGEQVKVWTPDGVEKVRTGSDAIQMSQGNRIPPFTPIGFLPPGQIKTTWSDFVARFDTSPRRHALLERLEPRLIHLREAGAEEVAIGGSFVTKKRNPGDVDALYKSDGIDFEYLKGIDPPLGAQDPRWQRQAYEGINFADLRVDNTPYESAKAFSRAPDLPASDKAAEADRLRLEVYRSE